MKLKDVVICDLVINGVNEGEVACDWQVISMLMDEEIREQVHKEFSSASKEEFLQEYLKLDPDFMRVIQQVCFSIAEKEV